MKSNKDTIRNFLVVFILTAFAKLASFFTELTVAKYLGTSFEADAYNMVFGVHYILYPMLGVGLWKAFMPEYGYILVKKGKEEARKLSNIIFNYTILIGAVASILIMLFSNYIVCIVAPGFDVNTRDLCSKLIYVSAPQYFFVLLAAFCSAVLQSHNKFFASNFKEIVTYSPIILFAILFYEKYGLVVFAYGILIGAILRLVVQMPYMDFRSYSFFVFEITPSVRRIVNKMPALLLTTAVTDLNIFITKSVASMICVGAVSALSYGERISNVITGLTAGVISIVIFPQMTMLVAQCNFAKLSISIKKFVCSLVLIILPGLTVLYVFSLDIVKILFMRGAFNYQSALITSKVFQIYIFSIIFTSAKMIFLNAYYAMSNTNTPMIISLVIVCLNAVGSFILPKYYGILGLASANVICSTVECLILLFILNHSVKMNISSDLNDYIKICSFSFLLYFLLKILKDKLIINLFSIFAIIIFIYILYAIYLKYIKIKYFDLGYIWMVLLKRLKI